MAPKEDARMFAKMAVENNAIYMEYLKVTYIAQLIHQILTLGDGEIML